MCGPRPSGRSAKALRSFDRQTRTSTSSPCAQVTAMLSGVQIGVRRDEGLLDRRPARARCCSRGACNIVGMLSWLAHVADGGEIVRRAQAGAGPVLADIRSARDPRSDRAPSRGGEIGRRDRPRPVAVLGVRRSCDRRATGRAPRSRRPSRQRIARATSLAAEVAEARRPRKRHHVDSRTARSRRREGLAPRPTPSGRGARGRRRAEPGRMRHCAHVHRRLVAPLIARLEAVACAAVCTRRSPVR